MGLRPGGIVMERLVKPAGAMALMAMFAIATATPVTAADKVAGDKAFMADNARHPGVVTLPGLQYKILKSGPADGPTARRSDDITVKYEGRFANGELFDASPDNGIGTTVFPLQKLIPGWIAALQLMRPGDVWMLYLPPNLAYGARGKAPIGPDRSLVFKIELVSVAPHKDAPAAN
jgi:FKBP-type peptidyl-prolyl cis-trans isomerase